MEGRVSGQCYPSSCIKQLGETKASPGQVEKPIRLLSRPTALFFKKCGQYEEFRGVMNFGLESLGRAGLPASILPGPEGSGPGAIPWMTSGQEGPGAGALTPPPPGLAQSITQDPTGTWPGLSASRTCDPLCSLAKCS